MGDQNTNERKRDGQLPCSKPQDLQPHTYITGGSGVIIFDAFFINGFKYTFYPPTFTALWRESYK